MEGSRFGFKFVRSLGIRCDKANTPKVSLYINSPDWMRYKNATINSKILTIDLFSMLFCSHYTIKKSRIILSEYQILNHLTSLKRCLI